MPNALRLPLHPEEVTLAKSKLDAVIATVPLFESLSKRHLKKVAGLTSTVEYNAGDTVIQEGEPGDSFFVAVVSGGKTLHRLIPGDHFGEISLLDGRPRSASVVAETPLSLLSLPRTSFLRLVKEDADLARALLASLARMVRRVDRSLAR
jgi:CRP/FNR family cyclic AMP-dependent transcriptional regulator